MKIKGAEYHAATICSRCDTVILRKRFKLGAQFTVDLFGGQRIYLDLCEACCTWLIANCSKHIQSIVSMEVSP